MWTLGFPSCSPLFLLLWLPQTLPTFQLSFFLSHIHRNRYMTTTCRTVGDRLNTTVERLLEINWSKPSFSRGGTEAQRGQGPFPRSHSMSGAGPGIEPMSLHCCPVLLMPCSLLPSFPCS